LIDTLILLINLISLTGFNAIQYDFLSVGIVAYFFGPPCVAAHNNTSTDY